MSKLIDLLKKGLEANPGDWNIRKGLIEQYIQTGQPDALTEVIERAPEMCREEATVLEIAGRLAETDDRAATAFVDKAIDAFPSNPILHGIAAKLRLAAGDMAAAHDHFQAARTFNPGFSDPDLDAVAHLMAAASDAPPIATGTPPTLAPVEPTILEAAAPEFTPAEPGPVETVPLEPAPIQYAEVEPVPLEAEPVETTAFVEEQETEPSPESGTDEVAPAAEAASPEEQAQESLDPSTAPDESWQSAQSQSELPATDLSQTQSVAVVASLEPTRVPAVPIQGLTAPEPVELAFEEVEPAVTLNFVPSAELELTRQHLNVLDPSGLEMDADQFDSTPEELEPTTGAGLLVAEPARAPEAARKNNSREKLTAILITIAAHVVVFFLIGLVIVAMPKVLPPEIVASPGPVSTEEAITKKEVVQQTPTKPPAPSAASINTISTFGASAVSVPAVEFEAPEETVDLGSSFGSGLSFGTGSMAAGGEISFMGNSGSGSRVVFAVDYSLSLGGWGAGNKPTDFKEIQKQVRDGKLRGNQKHWLMRDELYTAIKKLPQGTQYQIVMFSAAAWAHDAITLEELNDDNMYKNTGKREGDYFLQMMRKRDELSKGNAAKGLEFPRFKYLTATPENIDKSCEIVAKLPTSLGTNWEHPILMALSIKPKPDIVFFMTDGMVKNPKIALELIREANNKGKRAVIHSTAMMEPGAADDMAALASENGGKFTIVEEDGKIVKGEDFFKKRN